MRYIGEATAKALGYADERGYLYNKGAWVTFDLDNECAIRIDAVFGDETECLRYAIQNEEGGAWVPYGVDARDYIRTYEHWSAPE